MKFQKVSCNTHDIFRKIFSHKYRNTSVSHCKHANTRICTYSYIKSANKNLSHEICVNCVIRQRYGRCNDPSYSLTQTIHFDSVSGDWTILIGFDLVPFTSPTPQFYAEYKVVSDTSVSLTIEPAHGEWMFFLRITFERRFYGIDSKPLSIGSSILRFVDGLFNLEARSFGFPIEIHTYFSYRNWIKVPRRWNSKRRRAGKRICFVSRIKCFLWNFC